MFDFEKVPLPDYTRKEDMINSITHLLGVPYSFIILGIMLKMMVGKATGVQIFAVVLYIVSAMVVFAGSAIYHGMKPSHKKKIARVADHSNIYVMLSGFVTAMSLTITYPVNPGFAVGMIVVIWIAAVVGILFTFMDLKKFNIPQIFMYVLMGWVTVLAAKPLWNQGEIGRESLVTLLIGGGIATVGAGIYFIGKKIRYFHAIFHVFMFAGNIIIFCAVYKYYDFLLA